MSLENENVKSQVYSNVQLHRPEQPSITYLTLALSFSMRLKFILNAPAQLESGGYLALPLC